MSWGDVGSGALRAALPLALWGLVSAAFAARERDGRFLGSARWSAACAFVLVAGASASMIAALLSHDFSLRYVALNNARETPPYFSAISLWASLQGSILLWTTILAGAVTFVAWRGTRDLPRLATTALAILFAMLSFFLVLVVTPAADPFVRIDPVPADGTGPNPLLQDHWLMGLHPPLLYLGYVLFSIPFAYAVASLILGESGDRWITATRRSALVAWALLGVGIVAGAWWSYAVLGWGGYWAWDPVENAAIMPWLVATAYLHSVMVEEKRRMLRTWNLSLVIGAFALTILGTFLTRSGVINSVHSFSESAIGPLLLGYLAAILVFSVGLLLWRSVRLVDPEGIGTPLSREAIFLFQNVLFVAATLTVLLGTLYPLIVEAVSGDQVSIGSPYFDTVEVPLALALLFLMGVGPQLPWHGASRATLERQFSVPIVAAAAGGIVALLVGLRGAAGVLAFALAAFVAATVAQEFVRGVRARHTLHGEAPQVAFVNLFRRNGRRYGGYVVHVGIAVVALAVAMSQSLAVTKDATLAPGGSMQVGSRTIVFEGLRDVAQPQRQQVVADLRILDGGSGVPLTTALSYYPNGTSAVGSPGIRSTAGDDVYAILAAYDARSRAWATISIKVIPLVSWLWIGGAIVGLGALLAALPEARRGRRASAVVPVPASSPAGAE
ncbi:MAG: heme lyase CcmF/NrfE family subunit [Chloroflexota bacterium]|nr:heme lyase CcmF/NrfE family subunit [Chloroflexota bacterium]MDE3194497.1 heme lyase CcmF/NrfE family subunit [Chloroflexota bacterium]